eukprot:14077092-Ditylum_brightwellii.AAC.1
MYGMSQKVNHAVSSNCQDLVILDKVKKTALLIDATCPMDLNMVSTAAKKHQKCCNLEIAMKKQYKLCKIQTVLIVIGALGKMVKLNLSKNSRTFKKRSKP